MADDTANEDYAAAAEWPARPWILAALLGLAGLLIWLVTEGNEDVPWQMSLAAFLFFGPIAAAFTLERERWKEALLFALAVGVVMAGLAWRAVQYGEYLPDEQYGFAAGVVATALALPLFQAEFHRRRFATPYREIFGHVWSDAISAAGALAFTGIAWIVLALMSELFNLLKIDFLKDLMDEGAFGWTFSGIAAGAALGTIRNQIKVLATMQTVVLLVASLLAVPVAIALVVFLLATAISGPQVLWDATRSATPLLLACAAGAFVLTNAIARQDDATMTRNRVMRVAGWVLALVILPLGVFAAVSMGMRLGQYGFAPERLWGTVAIVVACVCGVAYWVALVRGRKSGWAGYLRKSTFHLGLVVCGLALLLALPILDFGAISTRNQLARLESGRVAPDKFDFAALRWDFGETGRRELRRLARSGDGETAEMAQAALAQTERSYPGYAEPFRTAEDFDLRVQPEDPELRRLVLDYLKGNPWQCEERCVALDLGATPQGRRVAIVQGAGYTVAWLNPGQARVPAEVAPAAITLEEDSTVEIREVPTRYVFIDGKPLQQPLDTPTAPLEGAPPPR